MYTYDWEDETAVVADTKIKEKSNALRYICALLSYLRGALP